MLHTQHIAASYTAIIQQLNSDYTAVVLPLRPACVHDNSAALTSASGGQDGKWPVIGITTIRYLSSNISCFHGNGQFGCTYRCSCKKPPNNCCIASDLQ